MPGDSRLKPRCVDTSDLQPHVLGALPGREYTDIAIRPFRLTVDGVLFGLLIEQHGDHEDEDDWVELYPDRLGFSAPWDGQYST